MINKSWCSLEGRRRATELVRTAGSLRIIAIVALIAGFCLVVASGARAGDAPAWMHAAAVAPLPAHDEKTDAVTIYSEDVTIILSVEKIKTIERRAYKILRPDGKRYGIVEAAYDPNSKITGMRAWCIPAQGKDYELKDKDAVDASLAAVESMYLATDVKLRYLKIPASEPGNIVGYEIEKEERPYILQGWWDFQHRIPVKEAKYSIQLPVGWEYKATWLNHGEIKPVSTGPNQWQWTVSDIPAIRHENYMPPFQGVAAQMIISFVPPGGSTKKGFENWNDMGRWQGELAKDRTDASPELKQKVSEVTASSTTTLVKMQAIAGFMQKDIRYVAITFGIGGFQPHYARDIYSHRYGDCKDKATLMRAMLKEIGVNSFLVVINTERGGVRPATPPQMYWFDHMILGIQLPDDVKDPTLLAIYSDPTLGRILIFDPTDEITPLGQIRGALQANYGLLVTPTGGGLIELPQLPPSSSGVRRIGKLKLSESGILTGDVVEVLRGDSAKYERGELRSISKDADRIKPIETLLSESLGNFQIGKASIGNLNVNDQPLTWNYSFISGQYAKSAGNLLLVRPRVIGTHFNDILEQKEPRKYPVEFRSPGLYVDTFEIEIPSGFEVDDLPAPTNVDYSFASYHSKTEAKGNVLVYSRTYEVKELSVPVEKLDQLKTFYRAIGSDERGTAVLKAKAN
jgi:hypothetical protein